jgi:hypothetical protein
MLTVQQVNLQQRQQIRHFVDIPYRLYKRHAEWVPPLRMDVELMLNKQKHPFYEHSEADFFVAVRDGRDVGRIAALVNRPFNQYHHTAQAQFYLFECEDDQRRPTRCLTRSLSESARLNKVVGPKGFGALDGYGLLVEGF